MLIHLFADANERGDEKDVEDELERMSRVSKKGNEQQQDITKNDDLYSFHV